MMRSGFLLLTLCLSWTTEGNTLAKRVKRFYLHPRFAYTIEAATQLLWKSFSNETRIQDNFLLFPLAFARDVTFIDAFLKEKARENVRKFLPLYKGIEEEIMNCGNEIRNVTGNDTRLKTILYANSTDLYKTMDALINPVYSNPAYPKDNFQMIVNSGRRRRKLWKLLTQGVEDSKLGITCEVRYCDIWRILYKRPSFAMLTLASWRIRHIAGFQWHEITKFSFYETNSMDVRSLRSVSRYDYAQFSYSRLKGCTGQALRIPYNSEFHLTFVIPSSEGNCSTLEELWQDFQAVDLNGLKYENRVMFVSIPVFSISANMNLRKTLRGTALAKAFMRRSSKLYKALAFLEAEFIFDPKLPANQLSPMISPDTPRFLVERPFFISIAHISSGTKLFAGLVLYPGCIEMCENQPSFG